MNQHWDYLYVNYIFHVLLISNNLKICMHNGYKSQNSKHNVRKKKYIYIYIYIYLTVIYNNSVILLRGIKLENTKV